MRALWPVLPVAGGSFAPRAVRHVELLDYSLTDVLAALVSLIATSAVPAGVDAGAGSRLRDRQARREAATRLPAFPGWQGWIPWVVVSVVVILWTHSQGRRDRPADHSLARACTTRSSSPSTRKPMRRTGHSSRSAPGTAILLAAIITAAWVGVGPGRFLGAIAVTWRQSRFAILTVALIVGLAYLMNYSGMNYTLGLGVASVGIFFPDALRVLGLGRRVSLRAATPRATRCSAICRSSPPGSSVSIRCSSRPPIPPAASWAK